MKKVVVNNSYGPRGLSTQAVYLLSQMSFPLTATPLADSHLSEHAFSEEAPGGFRCAPDFPGVLLKDGVIYWYGMNTRGPDVGLRSHPALVKVVELLGRKASSAGHLEISEIPNDALYAITDYDGAESVKVFQPQDYTGGYAFVDMPIPEDAMRQWDSRASA